MNAQKRLNELYLEINDVILSRQHPVTGLLPASTAVNTHGDYTDAWVRDNVYSIIAPWSLSIAYKRRQDTERQDELEQATIKLMRGLLQAMMRQSQKVEVFKHTLKPIDALHAKYDTTSGLSVVADDAWGHLQIDATSIFLLMIAQMTKSGLRIIQTYDEVDFVQNLIYYISSAYRTPDYGIWERGNKINNGKTEINASSVGMAKAALQALDGMNLFGKHSSSPRAVVHSIADAISLARNSLASLLPRESLSKEVDSALLSIIGFPAFAVGDNKLVTKTRDEILKKLGGKYGCKRFLWDGHQTAIEDPHRLYYEHSELVNFEHIESEWPLFFSYLYLNALFKGNDTTAKYYREKIESIMIDVDGTKLIPELYYLEEQHVAAEKLEPNSQERVPNENIPLVWAQSLYYTAVLIDEQYIDTSDLDGVNLRGKTTRFNSPQVALVVLAENDLVKKQLVDNGVISESIDDIAPIKVISAPHLVEAYAQVGANKALDLTGRPRRRLQSLATSQTYEINNQRCLCLSWLQSETNDYRMQDAQLVSEKLKTEIAHIRQHWLNQEAAVFTFLMTESLCTTPTASVLFDTLKNLQLRTEDDKVGYASASLAYRASREDKLLTPSICITSLKQSVASSTDTTQSFEEIDAILSSQIEDRAASIETLSSHILGLDEEQRKQQSSYLYQQSQKTAHWLFARLGFKLMGLFHSDLADYLTVLSARHFSIIVGAEKNSEFSLDPNLNTDEIVDMLKHVSTNEIEHCLLQEVLASIGGLQRTQPQLFEGLRSIQLHNLLQLCHAERDCKWEADTILAVGSISPFELNKRIKKVLLSQHKIYTKGLKKFFPTSSVDADIDLVMDTDWFEWRIERGIIVNLDRDFLEAIWQSLTHTSKLVFGDSGSKECVIDCELTRSSMTSGEEIFAQLIDNSIQQIHPPYYKSAIIETLLAYTRFCENNPNAHFTPGLNLNEQLEKAAEDYCSAENQHNPNSRDIDILLQESPEVLQHYLERALSKSASASDSHEQEAKTKSES